MQTRFGHNSRERFKACPHCRRHLIGVKLPTPQIYICEKCGHASVSTPGRNLHQFRIEDSRRFSHEELLKMSQKMLDIRKRNQEQEKEETA